MASALPKGARLASSLQKEKGAVDLQAVRFDVTVVATHVIDPIVGELCKLSERLDVGAGWLGIKGSFTTLSSSYVCLARCYLHWATLAVAAVQTAKDSRTEIRKRFNSTKQLSTYNDANIIIYVT